jgi:arylsulfatase A-like enzyme
MNTSFWPLTFLAGTTFLTAAQQRPNLLFIYTDDQRYDALSVVQQEQGSRGRFPWFKTPNLDRLAAEGVRFRNAFVVNSLCAPSRAVNLTGRYNHFNGIASNFRPFPTNNVTHATLLRTAGYTTAYIGKWHMDSQRERPGFDYHASFIGHARYVDPVFIVDGKDTPAKGWIDDLSTDYAIDFIRRQKGARKPWSLAVGFKSPHGPFEPPERAKGRFTGEQARAVPNLNVPAPYMGAAQPRRAASTDAALVPVNLDYFRCISAVDDCVGRLLEAVDQSGFASNTVVIYTSDNGFYLGEHQLGDKRSAYDESLRVPFLVRYPPLGAAARGKLVDQMVLNLDLAPSLLDLAGVPAPKEMQGRSWRPLLTGNAKNWRRSWFYEYFAEKQRNSRVPDITAVRTANAKLIVYSGHEEWTEMFNLEADPYETQNLLRDPAHAGLRKELEAEHERLLKVVGYRVPEYTDRPDWWGRTEVPKPDSSPELRLHLEAGKVEEGKFLDVSGRGNAGVPRNVQVEQSDDGRVAFGFGGNGHIELGRPASLNPALSPWTVEVVAKARQPDGVLVARGGKSFGYALWLKSGRPAFTVNVDDSSFTVQAPQPVSGWMTCSGMITVEHRTQLRVDGQLVAEGVLPDFIGADPHDSMQVGADLGSPVISPTPPGFTGWIQTVRVFSGEKR